MGIKRKNGGKHPTIKKENIMKAMEKANCPNSNHPVFCFRYLTTNNKYNFEFYKNSNATEKNSVAAKLVEKLDEMSKRSWVELFLNSKENGGLEQLSYDIVRFKPFNYNSEGILSEDTKYTIMRFDSDDKRIIGIKRSGCPIYHIIGFDFNHSAYPH